MTPELAKTPWFDTYQLSRGNEDTVEYLRRKGITPYILDVGPCSPLTKMIHRELRVAPIANTEGDLDVMPFMDGMTFDYIIYSHTIEHQFNPLHTLLELRKAMHDKTRMFIILPRRGKLLWDRGHYHEIDHYRMKLLLQRAGYEIISYELHKGWRPWWFYLTGIRPLMRLFLEYNAYYEVKKRKEQ